jgi:hypothetical protein
MLLPWFLILYVRFDWEWPDLGPLALIDGKASKQNTIHSIIDGRGKIECWQREIQDLGGTAIILAANTHRWITALLHQSFPPWAGRYLPAQGHKRPEPLIAGCRQAGASRGGYPGCGSDGMLYAGGYW